MIDMRVYYVVLECKINKCKKIIMQILSHTVLFSDSGIDCFLIAIVKLY